MSNVQISENLLEITFGHHIQFDKLLRMFLIFIRGRVFFCNFVHIFVHICDYYFITQRRRAQVKLDIDIRDPHIWFYHDIAPCYAFEITIVMMKTTTRRARTEIFII